MQICTVKLSFCAAKRLPDFDGKCQFVHGYTHIVEASFTHKDKNQNADMVVDFYHIKQKLGDWLNDNWDHNILLHQKDKPLGDVISEHTGQNPVYFASSPTAENLAEYLLHHVTAELFPDIQCTKIKLYDTEDAWVELLA